MRGFRMDCAWLLLGSENGRTPPFNRSTVAIANATHGFARVLKACFVAAGSKSHAKAMQTPSLRNNTLGKRPLAWVFSELKSEWLFEYSFTRQKLPFAWVHGFASPTGRARSHAAILTGRGLSLCPRSPKAPVASSLPVTPTAQSQNPSPSFTPPPPPPHSPLAS